MDLSKALNQRVEVDLGVRVRVGEDVGVKVGEEVRNVPGGEPHRASCEESPAGKHILLM